MRAFHTAPPSQSTAAAATPRFRDRREKNPLLCVFIFSSGGTNETPDETPYQNTRNTNTGIGEPSEPFFPIGPKGSIYVLCAL